MAYGNLIYIVFDDPKTSEYTAKWLFKGTNYYRGAEALDASALKEYLGKDILQSVPAGDGRPAGWSENNSNLAEIIYSHESTHTGGLWEFLNKPPSAGWNSYANSFTIKVDDEQAVYNPKEFFDKEVEPRISKLVERDLDSLKKAIENYQLFVLAGGAYTPHKNENIAYVFWGVNKGGHHPQNEANQETLYKLLSDELRRDLDKAEKTINDLCSPQEVLDIKRRTQLDRQYGNIPGGTTWFFTGREIAPAGRITIDADTDQSTGRNKMEWVVGPVGNPHRIPVREDILQHLDPKPDKISDRNFTLGQQTPEASRKLLDKVISDEQSGLFSHGNDPESLAKVILARRAIRILANANRAFSELGDQAGVAGQLDNIIDTVAREINSNPDIDDLQIGLGLADDAKRLALISSQCYLISNIHELAKLNRKRLNLPSSLGAGAGSRPVIDYNYVRLISSPSSPSSTINRLYAGNGDQDQSGMMGLKTYDLAKLLPYIRIYKVEYDTSTKKPTGAEIEFKFPNSTNVQTTRENMDIHEILKNKLSQEYGLKSFNWKYVGSDPFSYQNDIEATMVVYFQDFEQLTVLRKTKVNVTNGTGTTVEPKEYRFVDLLIPTPKATKGSAKPPKVSKQTADKYFYDIRVDVGNSGPDRVGGWDPKSSIRSLFLTMIDYDISFNQEGFFELTINYKSRLEQAFYDKRTNILAPNENQRKQIELKEADIEELQEESDEKGQSNVENIRKLEKELSELRLTTKQDSFENMITFLLDNQSIYAQPTSAENLYTDRKARSFSTTRLGKAAFKEGEDFPNLRDLILNLKEVPTSEKEPVNIEKFFAPKASDTNDLVVSWFYLGDLVEALAKGCFERQPSKGALKEFSKNSRILLTDFLIYDPRNLSNKHILRINIGDIPINVNLFTHFYYEKVVKYNVSSYPLMKFIRDVISYCILNIFEECFDSSNLKTTLKTGFLHFAKDKGKDPFNVRAIETNKTSEFIELGTELIVDKYQKGSTLQENYVNLEKARRVRVAAKDQMDNCIHALIISSDSIDPNELKIKNNNYTKQREEDHKKGLYHLHVGSASGLLKNITFSKTDQEYLREQRYTSERGSSPFAILSNVFDVTINLYGSNVFFPGQRIFLYLGERFSGLGRPWDSDSFANTMGIGGYHLVISVDNEISSGKFETKLEARWEASGDGKRVDPDKTIGNSPASSGPSSQRVKK
jgi:hypothetical protein